MAYSSTIEVVPKYLDCTVRFATSGGVSSLEDHTKVHDADSRAVGITRRPVRALQSWQLTWTDNDESSEDARFVWEMFRLLGLQKGFIFIPPSEEDRVFIGFPMKNTVTGGTTGDGVTTTFQLQFHLSMDHDIGSGSESVTFDINCPLENTVIAYADDDEVAITDVDLETGIVTLSAAPAIGKEMTADGERGIGVRWTSETVSRTLFEGKRSEVRSMQFKEIP